jgi:hypothetical protein
MFCFLYSAMKGWSLFFIFEVTWKTSRNCYLGNTGPSLLINQIKYVRVIVSLSFHIFR